MSKLVGKILRIPSRKLASSLMLGDSYESVRTDLYEFFFELKHQNKAFKTGYSKDGDTHYLSVSNIRVKTPGSPPDEFHSKLIESFHQVDEKKQFPHAGDWVLVVYNESRHQVDIVKDHYGYGKLVYGYDDDYFYFASSMPLYRQLVGEKLAINEERLSLHIQNKLSYLDNRSSTFYASTYYAQPGEQVSIQLEPMSITTSQYWNPFEGNNSDHFQDQVVQFDQTFESAVANRLGDANKIGILLSSGLDSTTVASYLTRVAPKHVSITSMTSRPQYDQWTMHQRSGDEWAEVQQFLKQYPALSGYSSKVPDADILGTVLRGTDIVGSPIISGGNYFWILNFLDKAKKEGFDQIWTGQIGNLTLSYMGEAPGFKDSIASFTEIKHLKRYKAQYQLSSLRTFLQFVLIPLLQPVREKLRKPISRPVIDEEWSFIKEKPERHVTDQLKSLDTSRQTFFDLFSNISVVYGELMEHFNIPIVDPCADKEVIELSFSLPNKSFWRYGVKKRLIKSLMKDRLPKAILYPRNKGLQAADLPYRISAQKEAFVQFIEEQRKIKRVKDFIDLDKLQKALEQITESPPVSIPSYGPETFLNCISVCRFLGMFDQTAK